MMIDKMFIPGQVESWIVIYDLGGMGLSEMPIGAIKTITGKMSLNFSGRLGKLYMVNAPGSMWLGWKTVSAFLDPVTVDKIKVTKSSFEKSLFEIADPSQVEEKYGGTQPNRTEYWYFFLLCRPFEIPPGVYDEKRLISDE